MASSEAALKLSDATAEEIRRVVSRELASAGVRKPDVVVRPGEDHDGDPAIMVEVKYRRGAQPFDGKAAARAVFSVNSMLHRKGEHRFAYIAYDEETAI